MTAITRAEILYNEDGPVILTRARTATEALALATEEADGEDMAVTDTEVSVTLGWIRATPCNPEGHETREGSEWCNGGMRCHYAYGKPGPGSFRGAFVSVRYLQPDE